MATTDAFDVVPETMLWNLHHRAAEARRPDAVLADPVGVELADRLGPRLEQRFGAAHPLLAQAQALRALGFDREVQRFLASNPAGTVVALGEGLETQFWRVDNGRVRWLSVDLAEGTAARAALLPSPDRLRSVAGSALDERWMDEVDGSRGVLITAQGLLMYFQPCTFTRLLISSLSHRFTPTGRHGRAPSPPEPQAPRRARRGLPRRNSPQSRATTERGSRAITLSILPAHDYRPTRPLTIPRSLTKLHWPNNIILYKSLSQFTTHSPASPSPGSCPLSLSCRSFSFPLLTAFRSRGARRGDRLTHR